METKSRGKIARDLNVNSSQIEGSKLPTGDRTPLDSPENLYGEILFGEGMVQARCLRKISRAEMAAAFADFEPK